MVQDCNIYYNDLLMYRGQRCRGRQQHCFYQPHQTYDLKERDEYPQQCSDNSHLVFPLNSTCNSTKLREKYHQTFCTGDRNVLLGEFCREAHQHLISISDTECQKEFQN